MNNIEWLLENAGPAIKLRMMNEGLVEKTEAEYEEAAKKILSIDKVQTVLGYMDDFKNSEAMGERELVARIHNCYENCPETFFLFLHNMGLSKGIPLFDEKIGALRETCVHLSKTSGWGAYPLGGIGWFGANIVAYNLLKAGYYFDELTVHLAARLNAISKAADEKVFDIYETDLNNIRQPNRWKEKVILKDFCNPYLPGTPLPLNYDMEFAVYLYRFTDDSELKKKIDGLFEYILTPEYQKLRGDYGWHWDETKNTYHASNPGVYLPLYLNGELSKGDCFFFLNTVDKYSNSPVVIKSGWPRKCYEYLLQYNTGRGTYRFPDELFSWHVRNPGSVSILYKAYISEEKFAKTKPPARKSLAFEIYGTFFMEMMRKRLET